MKWNCNPMIVLMVSSILLIFSEISGAATDRGTLKEFRGDSAEILVVKSDLSGQEFQIARPNTLTSVRVGEKFKFNHGKTGIQDLELDE